MQIHFISSITYQWTFRDVFNILLYGPCCYEYCVDLFLLTPVISLEINSRSGIAKLKGMNFLARLLICNITLISRKDEFMIVPKSYMKMPVSKWIIPNTGIINLLSTSFSLVLYLWLLMRVSTFSSLYVICISFVNLQNLMRYAPIYFLLSFI